MRKFQSTHPVWDGTTAALVLPDSRSISIHPSRVGWDLKSVCQARVNINFNPPIPCGMGRCNIFIFAHAAVFQSTHPVWDGTCYPQAWRVRCRYFNPPIPCGMGPATYMASFSLFTFQSTHPVWDGTFLIDFCTL